MKIRSFLVVLFLVLGVLYSVLSRYSHVNSDGAGMSFCIFGVATLAGLIGASVLYVRGK